MLTIHAVLSSIRYLDRQCTHVAIEQLGLLTSMCYLNLNYQFN